MTSPTQTAKTTIQVALGLVILKIGAFLATGSSGVLGSTLDSILDVLASILVFWAVTTAIQPADADHPWGHGKAEALASLFQSLLILTSGLGLGFHAVSRFLSPNPRLAMEGVGIAVMLVSTLATLWLVRRLRKAAQSTGSPALHADSAHYASDILTNLAVIAGLIVSTILEGAVWPDLMVGVAIALLILNTAREIFLESVDMLMDRGLQAGEEAAVLQAVLRFGPNVLGFHDLRTRRSGAHIFLELHLDLQRNLSFIEAHDLSEEVGLAIEQAVPRCEVTVHADPI
jgi:ferrous-iron efflux pump FieF